MIQLDALTLPAGLQWADEFGWQPVAQTAQRTLDGGLVLQEQGLTAGRPITLQGGPDYGWMARSVLESLYALASAPGNSHTLSINGRSFTVRFNHSDGAAIEAAPLWPMAIPQSGDYYIATIRFITA